MDVANAIAFVVLLGFGYSILRWFLVDNETLNAEWFE